MNAVEIHFKHQCGISLVEIAREFGIKPQAAALLYAKVEAAKSRFNRKEKVVYRKRLSNIDVKSRHQKISKHMRKLNGSLS